LHPDEFFEKSDFGLKNRIHLLNIPEKEPEAWVPKFRQLCETAEYPVPFSRMILHKALI